MGFSFKSTITAGICAFSLALIASSDHSTAVRHAADSAGILPSATIVSETELARFEEVATLAFSPGTPMDALQRLASFAHAVPLVDGQATLKPEQLCKFYENVREDHLFKQNPEWIKFENSHARLIRHMLYDQSSLDGKTLSGCGKGALDEIRMSAIANTEDNRNLEFRLKKPLDFEYTFEYSDKGKIKKASSRYTSTERVLTFRSGLVTEDENKVLTNPAIQDAINILTAHSNNVATNASVWGRSLTNEDFSALDDSTAQRMQSFLDTPIKNLQREIIGREGRSLKDNDETLNLVRQSVTNSVLTSDFDYLTIQPTSGDVRVITDLTGKREVSFRGATLIMEKPESSAMPAIANYTSLVGTNESNTAISNRIVSQAKGGFALTGFSEIR